MNVLLVPGSKYSIVQVIKHTARDEVNRRLFGTSQISQVKSIPELNLGSYNGKMTNYDPGVVGVQLHNNTVIKLHELKIL